VTARGVSFLSGFMSSAPATRIPEMPVIERIETSGVEL
jgi:hypothetical protein